MSIILFAMIGAAINAGPWYWICWGGYTTWKFVETIMEIMRDN